MSITKQYFKQIQKDIMPLFQTQALQRFDCIEQQSVSYHLHLNLRPQNYLGLSQIQFTLTKLHNNLFIDCSAKKILKLIINGKIVEKVRRSHSHLYLDEDKIQVGKNLVLVQYSTIYNTDQRGLMSFVDVDKNQYLYTTFEPHFAHRVFALFDQPDLKAAMTLSVTCPLAWTKVLSNQAPTINQQFKLQKYLEIVQSYDKTCLQQFLKQVKQARMAVFPVTKLMSTYLYCIMAGPFVEYQLKQRYNNIPMSFFCSVKESPYVQKMVPFLFQVTVQSMKFYQQFFGVPYSFSKYDQIFVHQMQSCAMENTGMVTYHDAEYIWKEQATSQMALDLANTMTHQLAHHWFGNLTTMKWWDDLWLNQSFAEFISYYVLQFIGKNLKTVKFEPGMAQFLNKKCSRGYVDDKLSTTHPIRGAVPNSHVAQSIFDGITYAKGASTLKQLVFIMGGQNFSAALKNYFTKYSFKNTTLDEFIECLQQHFDNQHGINLQEWRKIWIQQPSLNQLEPIWWKCKQSSGQSNKQQQKMLTIIQRPYTEKYPYLRPHKMKIALFKKDCSYDTMQIFIPAEPQISIPIDPQSSEQYQAIMLNYEDHAYTKVIFDKTSLQFFTKNLTKIKDMLTRAYIWRNFYDMVVDAEIPSTKYIELFIKNIQYEQSDTLVEKNYQCIINCLTLFVPAQHQSQYFLQVFYLTYNLLQKSKVQNYSTNRTVILKMNICKLAETELSVKILFNWYKGTNPTLLLKEYQLTNINKWQIVYRYLYHVRNLSNSSRSQIIDELYAVDESQTAKLYKMKCQAMLSASINEEHYQQQFTKYTQQIQNPTSFLTVNTKKYLIPGLNTYISSSTDPNNIANKYRTKYLQTCNKLIPILQSQHLLVYIKHMLPTHNLQESVAMLKSLNLQAHNLPKTKNKVIKIIDQLQRQLKAQSLFTEGMNSNQY